MSVPPMASEPAEPTTRQDEAIKRLAAEGLIADPAQTTELERLRANLEFSQETTQIGLRKVAELTAEVHRLRRELAEARARKQADLDELKRTLGLTRNTLKQNVEWRDRFRAERDEDRAELGETRRERDLLLWLHAEAAWRVVGFDALTAALARFLKEAQADRDALSLLLRGMARKLVAARRRIDAAFAELDEDGEDWHGAVDAERVRAALVGDQPAAEEPKPIERVVVAKPKHGVLCSMIGSECRSMHCVRCGEPTGPQGHASCFPGLSGVALRDVEEADDAAGDLP